MRTLLYKLKALLIVFGMVMLPFIIGNLVYYTIGWVIAWDYNPSHWWLFREVPGRILFIILELIVISNIPKFWDDLL